MQRLTLIIFVLQLVPGPIWWWVDVIKFEAGTLRAWGPQRHNDNKSFINNYGTYFLPASSRCPARPGRHWACGWRRTRTWRRWLTAGPGPPPGCPGTTPEITGLRHHSWNRTELLWENLDWPELISSIVCDHFLLSLIYINPTTVEIDTNNL